MAYPEMAAYGPLYAARHQMPQQQVTGCDQQNCPPQGIRQYTSSQHQQQDQQRSMEPAMACEETWPWDDNLLDSPGSGSFKSASTTYNPPSDDSIPDSYTSSTGSATALITAHAPIPSSTCHPIPWEPVSHLAPRHSNSRSCVVSKPPLAPVLCQLIQASEHRRYTSLTSVQPACPLLCKAPNGS